MSDVEQYSAGFGAESDCSMPCSGDPIHLCGGPNRLQVNSLYSADEHILIVWDQLYYWNGNIDVWHTPENTGYYEVHVSLRHLPSWLLKLVW